MENLTSIIIPCKNEEKFIAKCLDSIINQDFPKEKLEVLVVDGQSLDKTCEIVKEYVNKYPFIKLLENPKKITPVGLNLGIKESFGTIIMRMDAHAAYEKDYISKCLEGLERHKADNIGGIIKTIPANNTLRAKAIAFVLSHPFSAGGSFRTGLKNPSEVDTVFGGCYKREVFSKIGYFNENLVRSQDMEFNLRLKRSGGKIILDPNIVAYYYPKAGLFDFFMHNFNDGIWAVYPMKFTQKHFGLRHYLPLFFTSGLLASWLFSLFSSFFRALFWIILLLYFGVGFYFSYRAFQKERDSRFLFLLPIVFFIRHFAYGLGSIIGLVKLLKNDRAKKTGGNQPLQP